MKVEIRGHQTEVLKKWKDHIYERLSKLDKFENRIIKVDYVLHSETHHVKGEENELCKITAKVPTKTIAIKKSADDMISAIDQASHILEQQVHTLWKDVKVRNRHESRIAKVTKRTEEVL